MNKPITKLIFLLITVFLFAGTAIGQKIHLVKNIRKTDADASSTPSTFVAVGDLLYFSANTHQHGRELWVMDAKTETPYLVRDIAPGIRSSTPINLQRLDDKLAFSVIYGETGHEVWLSDGTASGTYQIKGVGKGFMNPKALVVFQHDLYFIAEQVSDGITYIWKTNVSKDSAITLKALQFSEEVVPVDLKVNGALMYMGIFSKGLGTQLWYMNAEKHMAKVRDTFNTSVRMLRFISGSNNTFYFEGMDSATSGSSIWRTDSTGIVATRILNENDVRDSVFVRAEQSGNPKDLLYFTVYDFVAGKELWRTDGTRAGTYPLVWTTEISNLAQHKGEVYFYAKTNTGIQGLWRINEDGIRAKAEYISTSYATSGLELARYPKLISDGERLWFFLRKDDEVGFLASVDSAEHEVRVDKDFRAGQYPQLYWGTRYKNAFYFAARDAVNGNELWKVDYSNDSISMLKNLNYVEAGCSARELTALNDQLIFSANDGIHGQELWRSTSTGAEMLLDIAPGPMSGFPNDLTYVNQRILFTASDSVNGRELWVTEGTKQSTKMLMEFTPGAESSEFRHMVSQGRQAFFTVVRGNALELWVSNGTRQGTKRVVNFSRGAEIKLFSGRGAWVYVFEVLSNTSFKIWVSDGTATGTYALQQFCPCPEVATTNAFIEHYGNLFFDVETRSGKVLWTADLGFGKARFMDHAGKATPQNFTVYNNEVHFIGTERNGEVGVWRTNGSREGTVKVGTTLQGPRSAHLTAAGDKMYFLTNNNLFNTTNIWVYQGNDEMRMGPPNKFVRIRPLQATGVNSDIFFSGSDGTAGFELWRSDGTIDSTYMVEDLNPGEGDSKPEDFKRVGDRLYFTASRPEIGRELHYIEVPENTQDVDNDDIISVFPNPTEGEAVVVSNEEYNGRPMQVDLYNLSGQLLESRTVKSNALTLDVSEYTPGIYILRVNETHSFKLIKI